jgi:uncharacterized protein YdaU (DUF1376 family)
MSAHPWMPLYVADYLADTEHLGALQSGAYLHLIMHYWQHRGLPDDDAALRRITKLTPGEWKRERGTLAGFFYDGWKHRRIDDELAKADAKHERRVSSGKRGGIAKAANLAMPQQSSSKPPSNALASSSPSPSEKDSSLRSLDARELRDEFERQFWPAYPHKVGKPAALRAFCRARKAYNINAILAGLERYAAEKPAERAWLNPATFLNQERFNDEPASAPNGAGKRNAHNAILEEVARQFAPRDGANGHATDADGGLFDNPGTAQRNQGDAVELPPSAYRRTG